MKKTAWLEDEINKILREKEAITVLEKVRQITICDSLWEKGALHSNQKN